MIKPRRFADRKVILAVQRVHFRPRKDPEFQRVKTTFEGWCYLVPQLISLIQQLCIIKIQEFTQRLPIAR